VETSAGRRRPHSARHAERAGRVGRAGACCQGWAGGRPPRLPRAARRAIWSSRSGLTKRILRSRSACLVDGCEDALSAITISGRDRGRPGPTRATRIPSSSGSTCGLSPACPGVSRTPRPGSCPRCRPRSTVAAAGARSSRARSVPARHALAPRSATSTESRCAPAGDRATAAPDPTPATAAQSAPTPDPSTHPDQPQPSGAGRPAQRRTR